MWFLIANLIAWPVWGTYYMQVPYGNDIGQCNWSKSQSFMYQTFSVLSFVTGVALIALAGLFGLGGPVTWLLSRSFWSVIARLGYLSYLFHVSFVLVIICIFHSYVLQPFVILTLFFGVNTTLDYTK